MPRYVVVESEEEQEIKTGRKTRAALAAPADSPMRRSTRIRHGSLNPDGSSPESVNGTSASTQVTRVTRRRAAAATGDSLSTVSETAPRVLRSRKNSASSNVSESFDIDSAPGTPRGRTNKRLSTVDPSPSTPKPAAKTKRSARAASETSSPAPVVRITRRTRASSIDPEPIAPKAAAVSSLATATTVSTPTRRRRTQVSVLPTEPVVTEEEINEDKNEESNIDQVLELSDELENSTTTPDDKSSKSLRKSLSSKAKKSSKGNSTKELKDAKVDIDESFAEKLSGDSSAAEISLRENKSGTENTEEPEAQECTPKNHTEDSTTNDNNTEENISPKISQGLGTRAKRYSSDKSKELGMKIEDLLNKSTEEQEKSPGNKENEKLNVSPVKIRKNLEFNVSNVNVVRGKSLGSSKFSNKSSDKKLNTSLDEQILSKSRHAYVAIRAINVVDKKRAYQSPDKKNSQVESSDVVESLEQNQEMKDESTENEDNIFKTKTGYSKVDEIVVENEIIEEFSLHDSDDSLDGSKNEFRLTVEGQSEIDKTNGSKIIDGDDSNERENCLNAESEMENKEDMFDPEQPADNATEFESENKEEMETDNRVEEPEIEDKSEDPEIQKNLDPDQNDEEEPMDTYEHEEPKADENASKVSPEKKSIDEPNDQESEIATNDQVSDGDSYMEFDSLFQNISAEEWNKNNSRKKRQSKGKATTRYSSEPLEGTNHENDSDSDSTVILQANDSVHNKKRNSSVQMIVEEAESDDTEIYESTEQRGSPNKSIKSNKSFQNDKKENKNRKSSSKSEEEITTINDEETDQECLSTQDLNSTKEDIEEQEEDRPDSKKNTPRNKKRESSAKSSAKSNKSLNVQELDDSSENEEASDNEEEKTSIDLTGKTPKKFRGQLNRNYSTVAVVDSDSGPENVTDPDCPSSDDSKNGLPGYLFNVESSGNEEGNSDEEEKEENNCSRNTIDSDIAKEMNLAGDDDVQYSDDNVLADDCRDSESEHSDENDAGSDLAEFIVPSDEVESSEYSDEEDQKVPRFKRIMNKSSSEDDEEIEETKKSEDSETKKSKKKLKRNSKIPDNVLPSEDEPPSEDDQSDDKLPVFEKKKLNFSFDSERSLSMKKTNKEKIVQDLDDTKNSITPSDEQDQPNDKKLKRLGKPVICLLDSTINLCTPEPSTIAQTKDETAEKSPGLNNSLSKKSLKKLRKSLARDLTISTPGNGITVIETEEEEELLATPKDVETPNKEKKTPKSGKKNTRDSLQLIEENCLAKPSVSDLNRTMSTPNSETPVTKFLKKETLNQSLPLIELKRRSSKMFDKRQLSEMKEDELEEETEEISEMEKQKENAEDSDNEENEENDDVEEDDKEPDANGHQDEAEKDEDGTDDEEENEDEDGSNEIDDENENEEAEESGEEEIVVEKKRSSSGRKSLTKSKEEVITAAVTPNKNQKRASTSSLLNGANEKAELSSKKRNDLPNGSASKKKRTRLELESSETPKGLKQIKKIKIAANNSPAMNKDSDSDEAPESLGFGEARNDALQTMKEVAASVKAGKEAKKKKRREQLERIRSEKEAKAVKKTNLKRLPDDVLENISEVSDRPKKKRKLIKEKMQQVLPSRYMFSPGKSNDNSWKVENCDSPLSAGIGTTQFSVISLEKVKKVPKKAAIAASFRDQMLARNPRQPVSAFLMHQAKLKASGKNLSSRK